MKVDPYDSLMSFFERYKYLCGDGYVELMISYIRPLIAEDEYSREYVLKLLYLLTARPEFKQELNKLGIT